MQAVSGWFADIFGWRCLQGVAAGLCLCFGLCGYVFMLGMFGLAHG